MSAIHEPVPTSPKQIDTDILSVLVPPTPLYVLMVLFLATVVGIGLVVFAYQTYWGLGVTGLNHPAMWAIYIATFVFWVGIAHAGTLISAILFLFRARWRNAVNRGAEAMTIFAVLIAAMFPLIHIGRIYKFYFMIPYPSQRGVWPNFRSPLVWDLFAINTYMLTSMIFFYVGLIPDFGAARDKIRDWRRHLYRALALGWRGSSEQWRHHARTVLHLSGLCTPLVLSVHSVVSWDFATSVVPGWHTTIFAPYFVAGAIFSGIAMVITGLVPVRRAFHLEAYLRKEHFDNMGKLILLTSSIVGYSYGMEYFMAWYSANPYEQMSFWWRGFGYHWTSTWIMISCNVLSPLPLWFKRCRTNVTWIFITSLFINVGMWFERYVIIVTGLSHEYDPAAWGYYIPRWPELTVMTASFALFFLMFTIFIRLAPVIAIQEVKELFYQDQARARGSRGGHH